MSKDSREYDYEGDMAMSQLRSIMHNAKYMHDKLLTPTTNLPEWVQSKITLAEDYISTAVNYLNSEIDESIKSEEHISESSASALSKKAKASGISIETLRAVYRRGVAAWNSGHRPGTTPQQWGMARVNSYITKGKGTYHGADKDLRENKAYYKGLSPDIIKKRKAHWARANKLSDRDPEAYKPAPGDKDVKTKLSKHTLKYRAMYGEETPVQETCWDGYQQIGTKKKGKKIVPNCVPVKEDAKSKRKVTLNKPFRLPAGSKKKFGAYVKNDKGNTILVKFGDPNLEIKRDNPERRKNFRARHGCDKDARAKDKTTPKYWSCRQWRASAKVEG